MENKEFINKMVSQLGFESLNEMQNSTIKEFKNDNDIILLSATGSGKTLAFLLPLCYSLLKDQENKLYNKALIIVPARELALQIKSVFDSLKTGLKAVCCYGGNEFSKETKQLQAGYDIIIATPGRLLDHIEKQEIDQDNFKYLILDEFDKSLEFGFTDEMLKILNAFDSINKKVLTSATQAIDIPEFIELKNKKELNFIKEKPQNLLTIHRVESPVPDKLQTLHDLICTLGIGQKIVFVNYRESVERISDFLRKNGIDVVAFHGGLEQVIREKSIARFRNGSVEVMVSTDLAARGLDIENVEHIIQYHIPTEKETFIHRNGRTARMNKSGNSYLILGPDEFVPDYANNDIIYFNIPKVIPKPTQSGLVTLYLGKGKKDKISKGDIAGYFIKQGGIAKEDLGMIEVKDKHSFVAVNRKIVDNLLKNLKDQKIKKMKILIEKAR